jgi:hypothetical protein
VLANKKRLGDFRRKRSFQAEYVEVPPDTNLDVVLQGDAVEMPPDANLDVVL